MLKSYYKIILLGFIVSMTCFPQEKVKLDHVTREGREIFRVESEWKILENLQFEVKAENEEKLLDAFWLSELTLSRSELLSNAIKTGLQNHKELSNQFVRGIMEVAYTLYPTEFESEAAVLLRETTNEKNFAMCAEYLIRIDKNYNSLISMIMLARFDNWGSNPILRTLHFNLSKDYKQILKERPPLRDLIRNTFWKGRSVIFSFQRANRDYPGIALIKNETGEFVKGEDGKIIAVRQLARSITNLPGYLTNGNTPEGIFSVKEVEISESRFIGPTENIQTRLPFEDSVSGFYPEKFSESWNGNLYRDMLPPSWQEYFPIYLAYNAGEAGRNEIIVHGTTIDPSFYEGKTFHPNTPSLGCLCAPELWSAETGELVSSEQEKLMSGFKQTNMMNALMVVVVLDDKEEWVEVEEILNQLK
ncbi:MAG: hypothetical protein AB9882_14525 [Ignavibacteriaceae bacterium]